MFCAFKCHEIYEKIDFPQHVLIQHISSRSREEKAEFCVEHLTSTWEQAIMERRRVLPSAPTLPHGSHAFHTQVTGGGGEGTTNRLHCRCEEPRGLISSEEFPQIKCTWCPLCGVHAIWQNVSSPEGTVQKFSSWARAGQFFLGCNGYANISRHPSALNCWGKFIEASLISSDTVHYNLIPNIFVQEFRRKVSTDLNRISYYIEGIYNNNLEFLHDLQIIIINSFNIIRNSV
jgi:hypothetical protein